jgi:hypothetical protein
MGTAFFITLAVLLVEVIGGKISITLPHKNQILCIVHQS